MAGPDGNASVEGRDRGLAIVTIASDGLGRILALALAMAPPAAGHLRVRVGLAVAWEPFLVHGPPYGCDPYRRPGLPACYHPQILPIVFLKSDHCLPGRRQPRRSDCVVAIANRLHPGRQAPAQPWRLAALSGIALLAVAAGSAGHTQVLLGPSAAPVLLGPSSVVVSPGSSAPRLSPGSSAAPLSNGGGSWVNDAASDRQKQLDYLRWRCQQSAGRAYFCPVDGASGSLTQAQLMELYRIRELQMQQTHTYDNNIRTIR